MSQNSIAALEERFAGIYNDCYDRIHAYAARRLGSHAADDVAAETFLVAWRRLEDMPAEPLPWLYGVAGNVVRRHRTSAARRGATRDALAAEPPPAVEESGGDPLVLDAWLALSPRDQEVLALIAWEELSVAEAARVLGCPPSVFSVRLHRARRRLERRLVPGAPAIHNLSEAS